MKFSKGQYRIISEIILFAVGILIIGYVIINFDSLATSVKSVTIDDQFNSIADLVSTAIVKVSNEENASIRLKIPSKISDSFYRISIKDADGGELIIREIDGPAFVERQLFNINYDNTNNNNNIINNSDVVSSGQFIEIVKNEKITIIKRN